MSEYEGYDVKQLWQMVDAARQGLQPSHDQAVALDKAQQMLSGHAQALATARDQLAAKWPPESNAASAAYLTELDRLITAVQETALTCAVNVFHLTTVSDAIVQTHEALTPLHNEYVMNEQSLTRYNTEIDAFSTGAASLPGFKTIAKHAAKLFTSPQVEEGRQAELKQKAEQAMVALAGAAQDGATYIKPPTPYAPPIVATNFDDPNLSELDRSGNRSSGGAIPPPTINSPASPHLKTATPNPPDATDPRLQGDFGPVLSNLDPVTPPPAQSPTTPIGGGAAAPSPDVVAGIGAFLPGIAPVSRGNGGRLGTKFPLETPIAGRGSSKGVGVHRGGIIGAVPDAGVQEPPRVSPSNGIIGQQPGISGKPPSRGTSGGVIGSSTTGPQPGRVRSETRERSVRRWDPGDPWAVDQGVDPVIMPDAEPAPADPGLGVIGIDR